MVKRKHSEKMEEGRRSEEELVEKLDMRAVLDDVFGDLKEKLSGGKVPSKELKKLAGDARLRYIVMMFMTCLENLDLKGAEVWGEKVEAYCIAKPREMTVGPAEGSASLLMESIARVVSRGIGGLKELEGGSDDLP